MRAYLAIAIFLFPVVVAAADEPAIKVGATIFADATQQATPKSKDADGNTINMSSFNVNRAYINITGNLNKRVTFRITPDVARESGAGSSLSGSQQFRLKYAYAQLSLDGWTTKGSFLRFGIQQTPFIDGTEAIYRYRFQGTLYPEREGYLSSSDNGVSVKWNLPSEYGDVHAGIYNGEGYSKAEANDQKAIQIRTSVRPFAKSKLGKGLRTTVFYVGDNYVQSASRTRLIGQVTFESGRGNVGLEAIAANDRTSATRAAREGKGWSVWATPRIGKNFELLLRHDDTQVDQVTDERHQRNIIGVAYWMRDLQKVTCAVLADYDSLQQTNNGKPNETRYGIKVLLAF